jgi:thiamine monophosphate synthase
MFLLELCTDPQQKKNARKISKAELQNIIRFKSKPKAIIGGINLDTYESNISNNFDMIAISDGIFSSEDLPSFLNMLNKS